MIIKQDNMPRQIQSDEKDAFVEMVARQLTRQFIIQLSKFRIRKTYFRYAGMLAEMFQWSLEFFELYYDEFESLSEATDVEEAVMAFGYGKCSDLFSVQGHLDVYLTNKYKMI